MEHSRAMEIWYTVLQAPSSSETAEGSSGLLCCSGLAYSMCSRGTSDAGGLRALCSSTVSMLSAGSKKDDASLQQPRYSINKNLPLWKHKMESSKEIFKQPKALLVFSYQAESRVHWENAKDLQHVI